MRVVNAKIPDDLAEWIDERFPHGFKQSFVERCFEQLRVIVEGGRLPEPDEYAKIAATRAIEMFNH